MLTGGTPNLQSDVVIAYHGTDASVVDDVLAGRSELNPSSGDHHWLGEGIYFWEDNPDRALWWARRKMELDKEINKEHGMAVRIQTPAVIGSIIYLGRCLDLTTEHDIRTVRRTYDLIVAQYEGSRLRVPQNHGFWRNLDCLVIDETCKAHRRINNHGIDTVRGIFCGEADGKFEVAYDGSALFANVYKVIAVRNKRSIVDYFPVEVIA